MPRQNGTLAVDGTEGELVVHRDRWGIPYIEAGSAHDAWFGLGFCQGQDRSFQLELLLRITRGTLSELVGAEALPLDRLSRRLGFHRSAARQLAVSGELTRETTTAYAAGIEAGRHHGVRQKAHEFSLLRGSPTPFTAVDALATVGFLSFAMASNWDAELIRLRLLLTEGEDALRALDPTYPEWLPLTKPPAVAAGALVDRLSEDLAIFLRYTGRGGGGSNNWAVAPSRTRNRRPLVANDPHLPPVMPAHWYLAHLRTPEWTVRGAAFVGTPGVGVGHNEHVAWGTTAALTDNTDLYLEEISDDGKSVRGPAGPEAMEQREETIRVRGGEDVVETVRTTPRGPIISPLMQPEAPYAISMRAVWQLEAAVGGGGHVHSAKDVEGYRSSFRNWPLFPMNLVCADRQGSICWQLVGELPRRRNGFGTLPAPAWDADGGWHEERVPFDAMPYVIDPEAGFVATANNQPQADTGEPFLGVDWVDGHRQQRICDELAARSDWDVASSLELQTDCRSLPWSELREAVLAVETEDADAVEALKLLRPWNGVVAGDSEAASVFEFFLAEMWQRVARAKARSLVPDVLGELPGAMGRFYSFAVRRAGHLVRLVREKPSEWFPNGWEAEIAEALGAARRSVRLEARGGSEAWGMLRGTEYEHAFGRKPALRGLFNRGPVSLGGDTSTIAQAALNPLEPSANTLFTVSLRAVMEVGDWSRSRFILPGGQSGNPLSPHYDDQLEAFVAGEALELPWTREEVAGATCATLRLRAKPASGADTTRSS